MQKIEQIGRGMPRLTRSSGHTLTNAIFYCDEY
jgi:hypothetical protein